jgi:hypothetical protein
VIEYLFILAWGPLAQKKAPLAGPSSASNYSATGDRQAAAANKCQFLGMITASIG